MSKLLSLVMIVKDEAASIRKLLEAAKPWVDSYTIVDTGSTDGTTDIICEVMGAMPGMLIEQPFISVAQTRNWEGFEGFIDFAATRNLALDLHEGGAHAAEFSLFLSGDEYLRDGEKLRAHLEQHRDTNVDCHFVRVNIDETTLLSPRVLRTGSAWRYEEIVHEVPCNRKDVAAPVAGAPGVSIEHVVSNPEARFESIEARHIPLLTRLLQDEPENPRALFFLAQSYRALTQFMEPAEKLSYSLEAMGMYLRRLKLPVVHEAERRYIEMCYLDVANQTGVYTDEEMIQRAAVLSAADETRPEPALLLAEVSKRRRTMQQVYELAVRAATIAENASAVIDDSPVTTSCGWRAHHLAAIAARQLSTRFPEKYGEQFGPLVKKHIDAGLAAGGVWMDFAAIMPSDEEGGGIPMASFAVPSESSAP